MRCLMPGARPSVKPLSAGESPGSSVSDEVTQLELQSQRQLEEDVARIFDESIYSDLEVVCGKLKILTHSCILKARTHNFYNKLEAILHVNIGRNTFDEIYSFISDAYTECNIKKQEKEIIDYLNENLSLGKNIKNSPISKPEEKDDPDVYSTPNCVSPEKKRYQKTLSSSPSTELTKEYYALVPIEGNILDRELIEQDALSNAFQSIHKSQFEDIDAKQNTQRFKPTSLSINSSHIPKTSEHSNRCDILKKSDSNSDFIKKAIGFDEKKIDNDTSQTVKTILQSEAAPSSTVHNKTSNLPETYIDKVIELTYTPDSLIADEPSSSSDYLSATYVVSPGTVYSSGFSQLNVGENVTKMDNIVTISDSGLETSGMLESLNSHKDVTLTDVSLTESTLHDMVNDDNNCQDSASNLFDKNHVQIVNRSISLNSPPSGPSTGVDFSGRNSYKSPFTEMNSIYTKEDKQRQNEEIVILESSSLSSETGSWESVFPPKLPEKDLCERFINSERKNALDGEIKKMPHSSNVQHEILDDLCPSLVQRSPYKSTSCFIDAASLADEGEEVLVVKTEANDTMISSLEPSQPVPCTLKRDLSPNDWSGSNDNEDSLEQAEIKDPDSIQEDISPTIFEMTLVNEDNLWDAGDNTLIPKINDHHSIHNTVYNNRVSDLKQVNANSQRATIAVGQKRLQLNEVGMAGNGFISASTLRSSFSTPNNSIISVRRHDFEAYESGSEINTNSGHGNDTLNRRLDSDDLNHSFIAGQSDESILTKDIENTSTVSDTYISEPEDVTDGPSKDLLNQTFWVVDMSNSSKSDISKSSDKLSHKPADKSVEELISAAKSVDSDSSEKSTHKFYIDLSTLPDTLTTEQKQEKDDTNEKKNLFSMFIDLGDKPTVSKEIPARFSSSSTKKITRTESKCCSKGSKASKACDSKTSASSVTTTSHATDETIIFEKIESLCNDPSISISEIINIPLNMECPEISDIKRKDDDMINKVIQEEPPAGEPVDLFVKLSDLDKPVLKVEPVTIAIKRGSHERMTRSIPDNDWRESSQTINLRSSDIISSFHSENALSLNRLFPHLKNDFSRSMPGSLSSRTKYPLRLGVSSSPGDIDECQASDGSEMSSVQSSYCRSVVENSTTEETEQTSSLLSNCQWKLGQDLLRMFLEEIAPDVIVEVSGRRIKAHKCILSSRCQYFAGILSGGWVESAGNVISLPPFTFSVVHFALCHIYSGVSAIPDCISIVELATIADMLGLEGLKEGIMFMLKAKYCHHFHKPCHLCTAGVLECFPLASVYGLDDLYRKCLHWITKHFHRVWPTKAFATLPFELIEKCYHEQVINLSTDNFVETVYGCGITVASLATSRWAGVVARMCRRLVNAAAQFAAAHLYEVLRAMGEAAAEASPAAKQALDDCLTLAIDWAPPEQACRAYRLLCSLRKEPRAHASPRPDLLADGAQSAPARAPSLLSAHAPAWRAICQSVLVRNAPRVVTTAAFAELPTELRNRLRERGCISYPPPVLASWTPRAARRPRHAPPPAALTRSVDIEQVRARFVPYAPRPQPPPAPQPRLGSVDSLAPRDARAYRNNGSLPPTARSSKPREDRHAATMNRTFPPSVRTTKAQEERAKYNSTKTNLAGERAPARPARVPYEHTKPRYMEPRQPREKPPPARKLQMTVKVSSSDSSRNSSPVLHQLRPLRPRTADPSTDSLSETYSADKYATYTKAKHNSDGSVDAVHAPSKSHAVAAPAHARSPAAATPATTKSPTTTNSSANTKSPAVNAPAATKSPAAQPKTTKIPVYLNKSHKPSAVSATSRETPRRPLGHRSTNNSLSPILQRSKPNERKPSGSLMNATKSSQAKMVSKTVKETTNIKNASKQEPKTKGKNGESRSPAAEIPIMERSGTFLKDEPMFGDKTTNIDIDE